MKKFLLLFVVVLFIGCGFSITELKTDNLPEGFSKAYRLYSLDGIEEHVDVLKLESDIIIFLSSNDCVILRKEK